MREINLLQHIAIIMDGNGRWAKAQGRARAWGHQKGAEKALDIIRECADLKLKELSLFCLSTQNMKRPQDELESLFDIIHQFSKNLIELSDKFHIKICLRGQIEALPVPLQMQLMQLQILTEYHSGLQLNLMLNYSGEQEICEAITEFQEKHMGVRQITPRQIHKIFKRKYRNWPDLIIRTGKQKRLSGFMNWQSSYAEIFFLNKFWPDFDFLDLHKIISRFETTNRRYGLVQGA